MNIALMFKSRKGFSFLVTFALLNRSSCGYMSRICFSNWGSSMVNMSSGYRDRFSIIHCSWLFETPKWRHIPILIFVQSLWETGFLTPGCLLFAIAWFWYMGICQSLFGPDILIFIYWCASQHLNENKWIKFSWEWQRFTWQRRNFPRSKSRCCCTICFPLSYIRKASACLLSSNIEVRLLLVRACHVNKYIHI